MLDWTETPGLDPLLRLAAPPASTRQRRSRPHWPLVHDSSFAPLREAALAALQLGRRRAARSLQELLADRSGWRTERLGRRRIRRRLPDGAAGVGGKRARAGGAERQRNGGRVEARLRRGAVAVVGPGGRAGARPDH